MESPFFNLFASIVATAAVLLAANFIFRRFSPYRGRAWALPFVALATWAVGSWLRPFYEPFAPGDWAPFFAAAVFFSVVLAIVPWRQKWTARVSRQSREEMPDGVSESRGAGLVVGSYLLVLLIFLIMVLLGLGAGSG